MFGINPLMMTPAGGAALKPQDVFATTLYTGNGGTQNIVNGLDLAGQGGLVWVKSRGITNSHYLADTVRGGTKYISSDLTSAEAATSPGITFNSNGLSLPSNFQNASGQTLVNWSFRRAAKFFDVVTYTGEANTKVVSHSLGTPPGMILIKKTSAFGPAGAWRVYHRSLTNKDYALFLNTTAAQSFVGDIAGVTDTTFSLESNAPNVNGAGDTYVAYLFAHDPDPSGIVQCGSYTGATPVSVTLGWKPQFLLTKATNTSGDWFIMDATRGIASTTKLLRPNTSAVEQSTSELLAPNSTGFSGYGASAGGDTVVYLAIREPI
jgi:hypothetical protein